MSESLQESAQVWQNFRAHIMILAEDSGYNMAIRQMGFEVKHMYFDSINCYFSIETSHPYTIPYTALLLGYLRCIEYIDKRIDHIESALDT